MEDDKYVSREEFDKLLEEVRSLTKSVHKLADTINRYFMNLLETVAGKVPDGCVPISTHQSVIKGVLWAFTVIVIASVGAVKLLPYLLGEPH